MITKAGARKLIARKKNYQPQPIGLDPLFPKQNAFIEDTSRYIDAQCSRRAGKTNGLAIRYFKTMEHLPLPHLRLCPRHHVAGVTRD